MSLHVQSERGLAQEGLLAHFALVPDAVLVVLPQVLVQIGLVLEVLGAQLAFVWKTEIGVDGQVAFEGALAAEDLLADLTHMLLLFVGEHVALQDDFLLKTFVADAARVLRLVLMAAEMVLQMGTAGKPLGTEWSYYGERKQQQHL